MNGENDTFSQNLSNHEEKIKSIILGYLTCPVDASGAYLGAIMITDYLTRPFHFSYISPIRPTLYQRILFGKTLNEHIKVEVIAKGLFSEIPRKPNLLLVDEHILLHAESHIKVPIAFIEKSSGSDPNSISTIAYKTNPNLDTENIISEYLTSLEHLIDLIEPFERIKQAIKETLKAPNPH
ncbi:MAG TPA: hypothetical protein PK054_00210 [Anaerohalosphaeraceae bacterium]|nr:hypothetical protein [Anaerohalosphaeraceae bacterium]HOL89671.1 hypothetical protein [Anaerohalosphaeraceae bacterium]HPP54985.1 hypothetical protein [Anaerohalosphaeraceae bacterium]